jgi:hypothetical protein
MPSYYFRFVNGTHQCSDCDPLDLPDDEAARWEAELDVYDLLDSDEGAWYLRAERPSSFRRQMKWYIGTANPIVMWAGEAIDLNQIGFRPLGL